MSSRVSSPWKLRLLLVRIRLCTSSVSSVVVVGIESSPCHQNRLCTSSVLLFVSSVTIDILKSNLRFYQFQIGDFLGRREKKSVIFIFFLLIKRSSYFIKILTGKNSTIFFSSFFPILYTILCISLPFSIICENPIFKMRL